MTDLSLDANSQPARNSFNSDVREASKSFQTATDEGVEAVGNVAQVATRATEDMARTSRETLTAGVAGMADAYEKLADEGREGSRQISASTARVSKIYGEAIADSAPDLQALTTAYVNLGQSFVQMQQTYFSGVHEAIERLTHRQRDMSRARSLIELAELQKGMYTDGLRFMRKSMTGFLHNAVKVTRDIAAPLSATETPGS